MCHLLQGNLIKKLFLSAAALAIIIATSLLVKLPGDSQVVYEFQNAAHTLAFTLITFVSLIGLNPRTMRTPLASGLLICACILILGFFIECAQSLIGRGFSPLDLLRNLVGVCVGSTLYFAWTSTAKRRLALIVAGLLLTVSYLPTMGLMASDTLQPALPILADFEQWGVAHRIRNTHAAMQIDHNHTLWPANATLSARVDFKPGFDWSSMMFLEVRPEWDSYSLMRFRVFNTHATPLKLNIRVDDEDLGPKPKNRMTVSKMINPGESVITIPLEEFRQKAHQADYSGQPLMKRIQSFVFFLGHLDESVTLVFDDVGLARPTCQFVSLDPPGKFSGGGPPRLPGLRSSLGI